LSFPDPEEQERGGPAWQGSSSDPRNSSDPGSSDDTDTAFARIVAGLRRELEEPRRVASDDIDDHFEPPEPSPLPVPRPRTVGGVLALTLGMLLLIGPNLLGLGERVATPLGLFALTAGIGWLVIGLRPDPPPEGSDDGAQL
jgi:hypothetical protein